VRDAVRDELRAGRIQIGHHAQGAVPSDGSSQSLEPVHAILGQGTVFTVPSVPVSQRERISSDGRHGGRAPDQD